MRETWGSRLGFILATAGFAVGLGNIWRFPYMVGENGGGAFLLLYVTFSILIGIPLLTAEISLGRKTQLTAIAGMTKLTGSSRSPWGLIGWLGTATSVLILSYYHMILAWVVAYLVRIVTGQFNGLSPDAIERSFNELTASPAPVLFYAALVIGAVAFISSRGLRKGVERVAVVAMPMLFVLLLILMIRSMTFPGAGEGLVWYLKPDFTALNADVALAALGQAFFSIGIGMATAWGFGSYLNRQHTDVPGSAAIVVACDTGIAFIAGLVIFPALFAFGIEPDSGPRLLFVTMANLFDRMPGGQFFGGLFFFLIVLAGLTSALAQFEIFVSTLSDSLSIHRRKAVWLVAALLFALTIPNVLSQGPWAHVTLFGRDIFALVDWLSGTFLLTSGALLLAVYVSLVWGWTAFRDETNVGAGRVRVFSSWKPFVKYIIPITVALILLGGLGVL